MLARTLVRSAGIAAAALTLFALPAYADVPASTVTNVAVSQSGKTITVTGTAGIADASVAAFTDPAGDVQFSDGLVPPVPMSGLGLDISSARIERKPTLHQMWFTLGIADPIANVFTLPEVTHYHWLIRVTNEDESVYYLLQAMRTGQYDRPVFPDVAPLFRVNACGALANGAPSCFDHLRFVDGTMAGGIVQWRVPAGLIAAFRGATIESTAVYSTIGFDGATYFTDPPTDSIAVAPYVVGSNVAVAITDASNPEAQPVFDTLAVRGEDGGFVGKLTSPDAGDYLVSVRACNGDSRGCAVSQVPITTSA
jgi:hypothetical protein